MPMRVYEGFREPDRSVLVLVDGEPLNPRFDLANHSPNGFEYGYSGSGPAQLALAILADHLANCPQDIGVLRRLGERRGGSFLPRRDIPIDATDEEVMRETPDDFALRAYQHFKGAFVAALDQNSSWRTTSEEISAILIRMANHGIPDRFSRDEPV